MHAGSVKKKGDLLSIHFYEKTYSRTCERHVHLHSSSETSKSGPLNYRTGVYLAPASL
jgi:hypothetical protein